MPAGTTAPIQATPGQQAPAHPLSFQGTYASGDIQVRQTDLAGNTSGAAQNTARITIDATAPVAPSFGLNLDSGSSSSDGISDGTIQVAS